MAVPQRTLNWLYGVLTKEHYDPHQTYLDPNRAYQDIAHALAQYPSLSPRTDVYTYENGSSALLLHLVGTLPVAFQGTTYRFPVALWIPNTYPREPPIVYVTPTQDVAVRVGQHVTLEGRVYHHYLAHWAEAWDRSTVADLLSILREVFAKEPPVQYRQQMPVQPPAQEAQTPPPIPPLPPGVGSATRQSQTSSPQPTGQIPPQPPPKPEATVQHPRQPQAAPAERYRSPPLLPPLPPKGQDARSSFQSGQALPLSPGGWQPPVAGQVPGSLRRPQPPGQQPLGRPMPPSAHQRTTSYQMDSTGPTSPGQAPMPHPAGPHGNIPPHPPTHPSYQPPAAPLPGQHPGHQSRLSQPAAQPSRPPYQHPALPPQYQRPPPPAVPAPKKDTPDLLTSPFEVELPSFASTGPAPPIPPNPEKDALLYAVSQTLAQTLRANATQSDAAAQSLVSQSRSLHTALNTLQGEITALNALHATLQSNTTILQQSIHRADATIAEAQARTASSSSTASTSAAAAAGTATDPSLSGPPPIDDVLVAPTVVGKQLYDLVADEQGIQQALYALQAALVRGVIGVDSWSRHTRGLAREAFLKRALIRKIGRGMGLEETVV